MPCNLFRTAWSNMIGNVGEAKHGQGGTGSESVAATATAGRSATAARGGAGRGRAARRCHAHDGVGGERATAGRRLGGTEEAAAWSPFRPRRAAAPRVDASVEVGCTGRGLSHRSVDAPPSRKIDRAALCARVQREPSVAHSRLAGFLMPTTPPGSAAPRRARDQAVLANPLAGSKKSSEKQGRIIVLIPCLVRGWSSIPG